MGILKRVAWFVIVLTIIIWLSSCNTRYRVDFNSNGGSAVPSQYVDSLSDIVEPDDPARDCYVFTGWYYDQSAINRPVDFSNVSFKLNPIIGKYRVTMYAGWDIGQCIISFDSNGGSGSMLDQTGSPNSDVHLDPMAFMKAGCTFDSWNTESDGSGIPYQDQEVYTFNPHENITLYAQWVCLVPVLVNFDSNGGTQILGLYGYPGDQINAPTPPNQTGCYFEGWYQDDQTFNNEFIFPGIIPSHNLTLYAKWSCCQGTVNEPLLASGMVPIYWDSSGNEVSPNDPGWNDSLWYDYTDTSLSPNGSHWANAKSEDGSYWVWIPRFVYRISNGWNDAIGGQIDVCFVDGIDDSTAGCQLINQGHATDSHGTWTTHPAFTYDSYELTGFWMAKFEAAATMGTPQIFPGVQTQPTTIFNAVTWSNEMNAPGNPYGFDHAETDTHLTRQIEWGAVAYLAHSVYGKNMSPIVPNESSVTYAGGGPGNDWKLIHTNQSTSGNPYGVYDMSGGRQEYVAACLVEYAGSPECFDPQCQRYWDLFSAWLETKGDALYETGSGISYDSSWGQQLSDVPDGSEPWFVRGGSYDRESLPGIFAFGKTDGLSNKDIGFRPVLIVFPDFEPMRTITFRDGTIDVFVDTVAVGSTIDDWGSGLATHPDPNCTILGWYYDNSFTNIVQFPFSMPMQDVTLYVKWSCPPICQCDVANAPILFTGMNPIYFDQYGLEIRKYQNPLTQTLNPQWDELEWYEYLDTSQPGMQDKSRWANAVSLDGSYWVWIPRYIYKITSGWHDTLAGQIDVCFVPGTNDLDTGHPLVNTGLPSDSNGTWTSHPAFTFGNSELPGFWFAKFEPSNDMGEIRIMYGVESWRSLSLDTMFNMSRDMKNKTTIYGWQSSEVDTHQMKNEEWGAVAYLAHSKFGLNGHEVGFQGSGYYTGGGPFDSFIVNSHQSTTGNPHGVYDMKGGGQEVVAAYVSLNGVLLQNACATAGAPYCTVYSDSWGQFTKGDAMWETGSSSMGNNYNNGWFSNYTSPPLTEYPWIHRGGNWQSLPTRAGLFCFDGNWLYEYPDESHFDRFTFRPVLVPKTGFA